MAVALVAWLLLNVPGESRSIYNGAVHVGDYDDLDANRIEHGWPLTYLTREDYLYPTLSYRPWRLWHDVLKFRPGPLCADLLAGLVVLFAVGWAYERWRRHRRRLLILTLRDLFLLTLLSACGCGYFFARYRQTQRFSAALLALGEEPSYALRPGLPQWIVDVTGRDLPIGWGLACPPERWEWPEDPERAAAARSLASLAPGLGFSAETDDLTNLAGNPLIRSLKFTVSPFTPAGWREALGTLTNLRRLIVLTSWERGSDGEFPLDSLRSLENLEMLLLPDGQPLGDDDLAEIALHDRLQVLGFRGLRATNAGLAQLAKLKQLRSISITGPGVGNELLEALARLPELDSIFLQDTNITDQELARLATLQHLTSLAISDSRLTEAGLAALARCGRLEFLHLGGNDVRRLDVLDAAAMPRLLLLDLTQTPITDPQVRSFEGTRPQCVVYFQPEESRSATLWEQLRGGWPVLSLQVGAPWGDRIEAIRGASSIRTLLAGASLRESDFEVIATLPNLEELSLRTDLRPGMLSILAHCANLRRSELVGCRLADDAAEALSQLELNELRLSDVAVSAVGWQSICQLRTLSSLSLYETPISDANLGQLRGLQGLAALRLDGPITDQGLACLASFKTLQQLSLCRTAITDRGIEALPETNPELVALDVSQTGLSAASVEHLARFGHLERLTVDSRLLEAGGVESLKQIKTLRQLTLNLRDGTKVLGFEDVRAAVHLLRAEIPQLESVEYQAIGSFGN